MMNEMTGKTTSEKRLNNSEIGTCIFMVTMVARAKLVEQT